MSAQKVAIAGASGNVGPAIVEALVKANFTVTALTRSDSKATFPSGVRVATVDYASLDSLTAALKGHDALTIALPANPPDTHIRLIDAAIAAGVSRILPSEFGSDPANPQLTALPVFKPKQTVADYLKERAAEGKTSYTLVSTGAFLDWGIAFGLTLKTAPDSTTELYDGGYHPFPSTTLAGTGAAVVSVLTHLGQTKNRVVYVNEATVTQNQLFALANKINPDLGLKTTVVDTADLEKQAAEQLQKSVQAGEQIPVWVFINYIKRGVFGLAAVPKQDDSALLGIKKLSDQELEAIVAQYAKA